MVAEFAALNDVIIRTIRSAVNMEAKRAIFEGTALKSVEGELLKDHVDHCLVAAIASDDLSDRKEKVAELVDLLSKR